MSEFLKEEPAEQRDWKPKFRPSDDVLGPKVSTGPGGEQRPGVDIFLSTTRFLSGSSAIRHMDEQYEGIDPDKLVSGETNEINPLEASDLT